MSLCGTRSWTAQPPPAGPTACSPVPLLGVLGAPAAGPVSPVPVCSTDVRTVSAGQGRGHIFVMWL